MDCSSATLPCIGRSDQWYMAERPLADLSDFCYSLLVDAQSQIRGVAISGRQSGDPHNATIHVFDDDLPGNSAREFASWSDVADEYGDELVPISAKAPLVGRPVKARQGRTGKRP